MMDEGSKRRKKKRGRSLIFKTCFRPATSGDDNGGKILASDDNLVYCDVTSTPNSHGDPSEVKKSSSSRGRMSRIFKAVLFDTAVKKKMRGKRSSSKTSFESVNSSPGPNEKIDDPFDDNNLKSMKITEVENSSNDTNYSKTDAIPAASLSSMDESPNNNSTSYALTERKVTPRVNSMDKKPPLIPSSTSRPSSVKPVHAKDSKNVVALKNYTFGLYLLITLVVVFVVLVILLWKSYNMAINGVKSLDVDSNQYTNIVVVGDEL